MVSVLSLVPPEELLKFLVGNVFLRICPELKTVVGLACGRGSRDPDRRPVGGSIRVVLLDEATLMAVVDGFHTGLDHLTFWDATVESDGRTAGGDDRAGRQEQGQNSEQCEDGCVFHGVEEVEGELFEMLYFVVSIQILITSYLYAHCKTLLPT